MLADVGPLHIVDDEADTRELVSDLLESVGYECLLYETAADFTARNPRPAGVIILDLRMPGESGLVLQRRLAAAGDPVALIFVSAHADVLASVDAMKAGAVDFLVKPIREQALLDAVTRALQCAAEAGKEWEADRQARVFYDDLTLAERAIMPMVASGLMNKQIAASTGRSENTVKIHRARLMRKTASRSVLDLASLVERLRPYDASAG